METQSFVARHVGDSEENRFKILKYESYYVTLPNNKKKGN
jgi:hypothetical protein